MSSSDSWYFHAPVVQNLEQNFENLLTNSTIMREPLAKLYFRDIFGGFLEIKPETDVNCDAGFEYPFIESLLTEGEIKEEPEDTEGDSHCVEEGVKDEPLEEETGAIISEEKQGEKGEEEEREVRPATGATAAEATPTALIVSNDYARKMEHEVELLQALVKSLQNQALSYNYSNVND
ncbi:hypothetical protein CAPTEDRAFT_202406 [Capitella teleta]|uniref:Uncharacterized protein n=1 Tax=Capitella teleta TaxID=283909 RepID=R7VKC1_CAPTE|nr:hypothetical protein CAPTEDRAFT_202406 [Capitella teleta]|eukprot:ELU16660.1 hypothetical protein CAPTEDRAFT_202406 [Capitella teleta]